MEQSSDPTCLHSYFSMAGLLLLLGVKKMGKTLIYSAVNYKIATCQNVIVGERLGSSMGAKKCDRLTEMGH